MEKKTTKEFADTEQPPDYYQKIAVEFTSRNLEISPEILRCCADQLQYFRNVYREYTYHNDVHSFGDFERGSVLLDHIKNHLPEIVDAHTYEILALSCVYHDDKIFDDSLTGLTAEEESVLAAVEGISDMDILDSNDAARISSGILVTKVSYDEQGVHQTELIGNSKDIVRFVMAFADIGAVLMRGQDQMINDVVDLAVEQYRRVDKHRSITVADEITNFLRMQPSFVDERLHDLERSVQYYFEEYGEDKVEVLAKSFDDLVKPNAMELHAVFEKMDHNYNFITRQLYDALSTLELQAKIPDTSSIKQKLTKIIASLPEL